MAVESLRRLLFISLILFIMGMTLGLSIVNGCFVKDNHYGAEVIIVKPGVTINLSRLLEVWKYATVINYTFNGYNGEAVAYRSACNFHYAFIIGFIKLNNTVYPVFTVKPLFRYYMGKEWLCSSLLIEAYVPRETLVNTVLSLGWKLVREDHFNLYTTITPTPSEPNTLWSRVIGVQDTYVLERKLGNTTIIVLISATNRTDEKYMDLRIECSELDNEVESAVEDLLSSLFSHAVEVEWSRCTPSLYYNPSLEELKSDLERILVGELEFLVNIGALRGLSIDEIRFIAQHIEPGSTGLNNTLVYDGANIYRLSEYIRVNGLNFSCRDGIVINETNVGYYSVLPYTHPCIIPTTTSISTTTHFDTTTFSWTNTTTSIPQPIIPPLNLGELSNMEALVIAFIVAILSALTTWLVVYHRR